LLAKANMSRFTTPEVATRQRATEGGSYMMTSMPALRASEIVCAVPRDESLWNATTRSGPAASIYSLRT
jgi:hypothetical protein